MVYHEDLATFGMRLKMRMAQPNRKFHRVLATATRFIRSLHTAIKRNTFTAKFILCNLKTKMPQKFKNNKVTNYIYHLLLHQFCCNSYTDFLFYILHKEVYSNINAPLEGLSDIGQNTNFFYFNNVCLLKNKRTF